MYWNSTKIKDQTWFDNNIINMCLGTGYQLEIKVKLPSNIPPVKKFISDNFKDARLIDEHGLMVNYEVPISQQISLGTLFDLMENQSNNLGVSDYALSQSTLEQIFLKMIKDEANPVADEDKNSNVFTRKGVPIIEYIYCYIMFITSSLVPGLYHFWLGNTCKG